MRSKADIFFELFYLFSSFVNLPAWLRNTVYILGALSVIGVGIAFSPSIALIVAGGLLLLLVMLGAFAYLMKRRQERRQAELGGGIAEHTRTAPAAINDPARRARLEDLRNRFQAGLGKFKAVGKDIYKLPWYVFVGEPAAGKSEAIRHCDVGFPPGMQDEFQGVGGTINMNWWFTNQAVMLDTAGRLLFEEAPPGTTTEWKEFLGLLRKHRPNCPVNGLILVIPADSLVKDSTKDIQERAGRIAVQLDNIQRALDIRFPVYVLISKCDLLNGFREFFEDIGDPDAQRQIMGWSNPDPLDAPFRPDLLDQHLSIVVERLRQRRLVLMEDPVARDSSKRRADEVDRLYAFPNSIALIASSLRLYLSTIFSAGEWSSKPLFLRGIYFTSSLREGSELDQELAQAAGVSVDDLPAGRAWERETSYFLRDLFTEKIFREWGLVTRATNTIRLLRRRQAALLGAGIAALAIWLLFSWLGYAAMRESIGRQSGYWLRASEGWSTENTWMPLVTESAGAFAYHGDEPVGRGVRSRTRDLFDGGSRSLVDFHSSLQVLSEKPLQISAVFRPFYRLIGKFESERKRAQRIVLEGSVVKPVLDSARKKIGAPAQAPIKFDSEAAALLSLIRIEAGIAKRRQQMTESIAPAREVIPPLETYVTEHEFDPALDEVTTWTYTKGDGAAIWPGDWMSGGDTLARGKPGYNQAIDVGIERFRKGALQILSESAGRWQLLRELVDFLKVEYQPREQALFQIANAPSGLAQAGPALEARYQEFDRARTALDGKVDNAKSAGLFKDGPPSLLVAYQRIIESRGQTVALIKQTLDKMIAESAFAEIQTRNPSPLLKEIQARLSAVLKEIQAELLGLNTDDLKALDEAYIAGYENSGPIYRHRASLYARSIANRQLDRFQNLIGSNWAAMRSITDDLAKTRADALAYRGKFQREVAALCAYWLDFAEARAMAELSRAYLREAKKALDPLLHFPISWPPEPQGLPADRVRAAANLLQVLHRELRSDALSKFKPESKTPLVNFDRQITLLDPVLRTLVTADGRISSLKISVVPQPRAPVTGGFPAPQTAPAVRAPVFACELRAGTPTSGDHENIGGQGKARVGQTKSLIERTPADTVFHFHSYLDNNMREVECGTDWSALRLLTKTVETSEYAQDGMNWTIRFDDPGGPIFILLQFEGALPPLARWPRREMLDLRQ